VIRSKEIRGVARTVRNDRSKGTLALVACVAWFAALPGCEGRAPHADAGSAHKATPIALDGPVVAEIDLSRGVPEARASSLFGPTSQRSHADLVRALRALAEGGGDAPAKGVLVRVGAGGVGLARAQEIGDLLADVRKLMPVVCHADEYGNATLMLAARGCSKIWVSPAGGVESIGIAAQMLYMNRLLERFHVSVDFLQVGKYKGAEEPFTRDGPSPEARASLVSALTGMRAAWLHEIAEGRGKPGAAEAAEDGPYAPEEALARGLVDAVGYADEARDDAKKQAGVDRIASRFGSGEGPGGSHGIASVLRAVSGTSHAGVPHVALVPAVGEISMSASPSLLGGGDGITERDLGRLVSKLTADASTKAVVLRIDSPGGSALASDLLWKKLMKLRAEKPLVISVGDMAASGGYYLSCAGTKIVAEPTSLLGSIGVVGGKFALGRTLEDIGVHAETIAASPDPLRAARASYMSALTPWDDPTRARVLATMKSVYDLFVSRVAEGRGMAPDRVAVSAEGRVYGGLEAKERGMIDEIGGLAEALDLATKLAGLPKDAPVDVVGHEQGLLELLEEGDASQDGDDAGESMARGARRAAREAVLPEGLGRALPGAAVFMGSLAPLCLGERAVAAMPFGVTVQ
jgi:protease IV